MSKLRHNENLLHCADSSESLKGNDYKGIFYNDTSEKKYYEGGAHFNYKELCKRLNHIAQGLSQTLDRSKNNLNLKYFYRKFLLIS